VTAPSETARYFADQVLPYSSQLYRTALRLTRNREDAEDLVQETYAKAYAGFGSFVPGSNLRAWLGRIELNTFCSAYQARQRRPREVPADWAGEAGRARVRSAEETALAQMPDTKLWDALRGLPRSQMITVYLADVEGLRYTEIAQTTGVPIGTVMSRLHRGRTRLRSRLDGPAGRFTSARGRASLGVHSASAAG